MDEVVVIGGGIVGAGATYCLAREGVRVTLVDQGDPGQATAAGAGIISPGTSFRPPAAFFPLAFRSVEYYPRLLEELAEDGETASGYEEVGLLHVAMDEEEETRLPSLLRLVEERKAAGVRNIGEISLLDARSARELFPVLGSVRGALHTSGAARVDGRLLRDAMLRAAERRGARVLRGKVSLVPRADHITGVEVDGEGHPADAVLIAGGAWSGALARSLMLDLPVYPQRGQILHLGMPGVNTSSWPIVVGFHTHYLLTFPTDRVVAGTTREDGSGFDSNSTAGGIYEALDEALRVAPGLGDAVMSEVRVGLRPATPDGLPIIGPVPGVGNAYIATGHGASGLQLGPYTGAVLADLLLGRRTQADLLPFAPERFR